MKLTKDTLIEGQIVKRGTNISIREKDSPAQDKEDSAQYKKFMKDFKDGKMKDQHGNVVTSEKQAHMIANAKSEADDKKKESAIKEYNNLLHGEFGTRIPMAKDILKRNYSDDLLMDIITALEEEQRESIKYGIPFSLVGISSFFSLTMEQAQQLKTLLIGEK